MTQKKRFLLRIDPDVHSALEKWAADDLRSVNAQVEFLLREAVMRAARSRARHERGRDSGGGGDGDEKSSDSEESDENDDAAEDGGGDENRAASPPSDPYRYTAGWEPSSTSRGCWSC